MKKRYVVLGLSAVLALGLAVPALGGSGPTATTSASGKKTAKKALKKAKKASKQATAAQGDANDALAAANGAQTAADAATAAQGGVSLSRVSYVRETADGNTTEVLNTQGFRVLASCPANDLEVFVRTTVNDSLVESMSFDVNDPTANDNGVSDEDFDTNDNLNLLPTDDDEQNGHTEYLNPDLGQVTFHWSAIDGAAGFNDPECAFTGHAESSGAPAAP